MIYFSSRYVCFNVNVDGICRFIWFSRLCFYQTRSTWSMDQGSNKNHSPINNFTPTVTKFCVMWEGQALPHDTKFGNCRDKIVDSRAFLSWSLIHGSSSSRLIKAEPEDGHCPDNHKTMVLYPIVLIKYQISDGKLNKYHLWYNCFCQHHYYHY